MVSYNDTNASKYGQYTHGSLVSHLSLDALHREQDRVYLRRLDFESEETLALLFPSFAVLSFLVGGILNVLYVCIAPRAPYGICHSIIAGEEGQGTRVTESSAYPEKLADPHQIPKVQIRLSRISSPASMSHPH